MVWVYNVIDISLTWVSIELNDILIEFIRKIKIDKQYELRRKLWCQIKFLKASVVGCRCSNGENATLSEFEEVLKAMKMNSLIPLASRVFDLFDNNRDGTVDMREILCGLSSLKNSRGDEALRLCFQVNISVHKIFWNRTV